MFDLFSNPQAVAQQWDMIVSQFPFATWETLYSLVLEVIFAYVIGLPLGVLLVTGERDGIRPLPGWLMKLMNIVINLLRSVPFLILMIIALPLSTWKGHVARIAFNGNASADPIIASVAMDLGMKVSILGAATRNVDGKAFGTMLVSLPDDEAQKKTIMDYLNAIEGVDAEEVQ